MEKQIDNIGQMARIMCGRDKDCLVCPIQSPCLMRNCAELLNAEDYRKASDVAHNCCISCVEAAHTADVVEVRHGEWEYRQLDEYKFYEVTCSCCGAKYWGNYDSYNDPDDFYYCPNCGAKMDGERRSE